MMLSNMKYKIRSEKLYRIYDSWWVVFICALAGLFLYGMPGSLIGGCIGFIELCVIEIYWGRVAFELQWSDIEIAVQNYASYYFGGFDRIEFTVHGRKIVFAKQAVLRVTKNDSFTVWYKSDHWSNILDDNDESMFTNLCQRSPVRDAKWDKGKTFLIPQQEDTQEVLAACLSLIKYLISKAGGTMADVTATDNLGGRPSVWVDARDQQISPVLMVEYNFKGKINGRPVLSVIDRKEKMILREDGTLEPFIDFAAWWDAKNEVKIHET